MIILAFYNNFHEFYEIWVVGLYSMWTGDDYDLRAVNILPTDSCFTTLSVAPPTLIGFMTTPRPSLRPSRDCDSIFEQYYVLIAFCIEQSIIFLSRQYNFIHFDRVAMFPSLLRPNFTYHENCNEHGMLLSRTID